MVIYTMEYYSVAKKKNMPFATTWMDFKGFMLSEKGEREKDIYCMFSRIRRI